MKIAIIQFPGSNCERETMLAVQRAGMEPVEVLWNSALSELSQYLGFIIVGGFSYEDRSRAGVIAALDPIMDALIEQNELGKPILGICNGAQILVEKGLVPGLKNYRLGAALAENIRIKNDQIQGGGYYNAWSFIRMSHNSCTIQKSAFTRYLKSSDVLPIPVAHGEGRFVISSEILTEIQLNGQNVFQYCSHDGKIVNEFPMNPNGSIDNIAALSNKSGNVLAMMPHPERTTQCDIIFHSMREYIRDETVHKIECMPKIEHLHYQPKQLDILSYPKIKSDFHFEILVGSILIDNHAMSIESALGKKNIGAHIHRYIHWEIECDSNEGFEKIKKSGVLFNEQKEYILDEKKIKKNDSEYILISPKTQIEGKKIQQILEKHFCISGIKTIAKNIVWEIAVNSSVDSNSCVNQILNSHILFNPYADTCYKY